MVGDSMCKRAKGKATAVSLAIEKTAWQQGDRERAERWGGGSERESRRDSPRALSTGKTAAAPGMTEAVRSPCSRLVCRQAHDQEQAGIDLEEHWRRQVRIEWGVQD